MTKSDKGPGRNPELQEDIHITPDDAPEHLRHYTPSKDEATATITVAKITIIGTIGAALIGLVGVLLAPAITGHFEREKQEKADQKKQEEDDKRKQAQIEEQKKLLSADDQLSTLRYLEQQTAFAIWGRYDGAPSLPSPADDLQIIPIGAVDNFYGISIVSPPGTTTIIKKFYLQIDGWAPCTLRSESYATLGFRTAVSKAFNISETFSIYPIQVMDRETFAVQQQAFTGSDVNTFSFFLNPSLYKLYFVSFHVEYIDARRARGTRHAFTKPIPLIKVENGNVGGCLDIDRWWKPEMNKVADDKHYDTGIPLEIYAYLTENYARSLEKTPEAAAFSKKFREFYDANQQLIKGQEIFKKNADRLMKLYP